MSEYTLRFSPDLEIEPEAFAAFWNSQVALKQQAVAQVQGSQAVATYDLPAWATVVLAFIGTMAADVAKDLIKDKLKEFVQQSSQNLEHSQPKYDVIEKTEDGKIVIIILPKQD
jgi:hypothetical protein